MKEVVCNGFNLYNRMGQPKMYYSENIFRGGVQMWLYLEPAFMIRYISKKKLQL